MPAYKQEQLKAKLEVEATRRVLYPSMRGGTPADFGIKRFKRKHKGEGKVVANYKTSIWGAIRQPKETLKKK